MSERLEISNPLNQIDAVHNQIEQKEAEQQRIADEQAAKAARLAQEATDWDAAISENAKREDRIQAWAQPEPYITPNRRASKRNTVAPLQEVRSVIAHTQSELGKAEKRNPSEPLADRPSHSYIEKTTLQDIIARNMGTHRNVKTSTANYYKSLDEQPYKDAAKVLSDDEAKMQAALQDARSHGQEVLVDNLERVLKDRAEDAKNQATKEIQAARQKAAKEAQAARNKADAELEATKAAETLDATKVDQHSLNVLAALQGKAAPTQPAKQAPQPPKAPVPAQPTKHEPTPKPSENQQPTATPAPKPQPRPVVAQPSSTPEAQAPEPTPKPTTAPEQGTADKELFASILKQLNNKLTEAGVDNLLSLEQLSVAFDTLYNMAEQTNTFKRHELARATSNRDPMNGLRMAQAKVLLEALVENDAVKEVAGSQGYEYEFVRTDATDTANTSAEAAAAKTSSDTLTHAEHKTRDENSQIDAKSIIKHVEDTIYESTIERVIKIASSSDESLSINDLMKLAGLDKQMAAEMVEYLQAKEIIAQQTKDRNLEDTEATPKNDQRDGKENNRTSDDKPAGSTQPAVVPASKPDQMSAIQAKRQGAVDKPAKTPLNEKRLSRMLTKYEALLKQGNTRDSGKIAKLSANIDYMRNKLGDQGDKIAARNLTYLQRQNQLSGLGKSKILHNAYREALESGKITDTLDTANDSSRSTLKRSKSNPNKDRDLAKSIRDRGAIIAEKLKDADKTEKAKRVGVGALRAYQAVDTKFRAGFDKAYDFRDDKVYGPIAEKTKSRRESAGKRLGTLATGARAVASSRQKLAERRDAKEAALVQQRNSTGRQPNSDDLLRQFEELDRARS